MEVLANRQQRTDAGMSPSNDFLNYTRMSDDGYNEITDIRKTINIPIITAASVRHRSSTMFWDMAGIDDQSLDLFMQHLGHSKEIDTNI